MSRPCRVGRVGLVGLLCSLVLGCEIIDDLPIDAGPLGPDICADGEDNCSDYDEAHALVTAAEDTCAFLFDCCLDENERVRMAETLLGGEGALQ